MKNLFISINFEGGDQSTYNGVVASIGKKSKTFNTGEPTVDWINMYKWALDKEFFTGVCSSSVDHFVMDGDKYKKVYIDHDNGNEFTNSDDKPLYIVNSDIECFEDQLAYYKKHNK